MRILNLYAGLGGNRKLWTGVDVVAVELDPEIATLYAENFPEDEVVAGDAHAYLESNYASFDLVWSSPPCQSHSKVRMMASKAGSYAAVMPDMKLWSEILFLRHFFPGPWVVENVKPYYWPLLQPNAEVGRHLFWTNFHVEPREFDDGLTHNERGTSRLGAFDLRGKKLKGRKDQMIRNSVDPRIGAHLLECALRGRRLP